MESGRKAVFIKRLAIEARFFGVVSMVGALSFAACGKYELKEKDESSSGGVIIVEPSPDPNPSGIPGDTTSCETWTTWIASSGSTTVQGTNYRCFQKEGFAWRTSCTSGSCREINVFAHYMLDRDLGAGRTVQIEAFDNKHFQGAPKASVEINAFHAKKGEWKEAKLMVDPGEYYLRAFIGSTDEVSIPYQMGGMKAVRGEAFGVYGALSAPEKVMVFHGWSGQRAQEPVHLKLDTLVTDPDADVQTQARYRFTIAVADMSRIQMGRSVVVALLDEADPARMPAETFTVATDTLFIAGKEGKSEILTKALEIGSYFVFAFVDLNGNGFADEAEPQVVYQADGQPKKVALREKYTVTIPLAL